MTASKTNQPADAEKGLCMKKNMAEQKAHIEKKWNQLEAEGKMQENGDVVSFSSDPEQDEECDIDIDQNAEGVM